MKVELQARPEQLQRNEETRLRHVGDLLIRDEDKDVCLSVSLWLDDNFNLIITGEGSRLLDHGRFSAFGEHQAVFFTAQQFKARLHDALK